MMEEEVLVMDSGLYWIDRGSSNVAVPDVHFHQQLFDKDHAFCFAKSVFSAETAC